MKITIKQGDTRTALRATLMGADNSPVDLTGASVRFVMGERRYSPIISREAVVVDAVGGQVLFTFEPGDTDKPSSYQAEFRATFLDGRTETYPNDRYIVIEIMPSLE